MTNLEEIVEVVKGKAKSTNKEICGLVDNDLNIYFISNVSTSPHYSFVMDKFEYIKAVRNINSKDLSIKFIFHSHPVGNSKLSEKDTEIFNKLKTDFLVVAPNDWSYYKYE